MKRHPQSDLIWDLLRNPGCTACGLHAEAQSVCLLGDGPVPCDIMAIGEGPGNREDNVQIPFSGRSGILLRRTMKECGLDPREVYITNVVACRPPGNRTPTTSEAKTCSNLYLMKQIEIVKPKVILCLGNVAVQFAMGRKAAVTKLEGTTFKYKATSFLEDSIICVPSRHPSAVLRLEDFDQELYKRALQQLRENILLAKRTLHPTEDHFKFKNGFPLPHELAPHDAIYTDLESNGLNPFREESKIWCNSVIQNPLHDPWTAKIAEHEDPELARQEMRRLLLKHPIIAHRSTFEGTWYLWHFGVEPRIYFDTKVGAYIMDENDDTGLKYQCIRWLGVDPWTEEMDWQNPDYKKMLPYNARDSKYGRNLMHRVQLPYLRHHPKMAKLLKYIVFPAIEVFIQVICHGAHIDLEQANRKLIECRAHMRRLNDELNIYAGKEVNPGSPKQMNWLFYEKLGMTCPPDALTAKANPSTADKARIRLKLQPNPHPVIDVLDEWHKWQKFEGTYLVPWIRQGPILHFNYGFTDTDTGRLNSTMVKNKRYEKKLGATMHQCPRDGFIRNLFVPRGYSEYHTPPPETRHPEDWCIVAGDLAQAELRLVADAANELTMIEVFHKDPNTPEGDIHYQTARELVSRTIEITKELRKKAKAVNFGFVYGMFWRKFQSTALEKYDLRLTKQVCQDYRKKFFAKYNRLEPWHRRVETQVSATGFIDSWFGARRRVPAAKSDSGVDEWIKREAVRQAINSPIQRTASDIILLLVALVASKSMPWKFKIDSRRCFGVGSAHDSFVWETEKSYVPELKQGLSWTMSKLPEVTEKYFNFRFKVPIILDVNCYEREWEGKELNLKGAKQ